MPERGRRSGERVLVFAHSRREAAWACGVLRQAGTFSRLCAGIDDLCERLAGGPGAVLLTDDALTPATARRLLETLKGQPVWSDVPLVVLTPGRRTATRARRPWERLRAAATVCALAGPARAQHLVAAIRAALRGRRRQYRARDYLAALERASIDLRAALADAERASQGKDRFAALLGHELRSPLAAIENGLEVLDRLGAGHPDADRFRMLIARQIRHLSHLIDDLLEASRLLSTEIVPERARVDLRAIARQGVHSIRETDGAGGSECRVLVDNRPVVVEGDPARLIRIVRNLLHAAVACSLPAGPIQVLVRRERRHAVVRVRHRGVGLAPTLRQALSEPFARIDAWVDRLPSGVWPRLSLARELVERHSGSLTTRRSGSSSEFLVRLRRPARRRGPLRHHPRGGEVRPVGRE